MEFSRISDEIAVITLDRPDCGNALSEEVLIRFEETLRKIHENERNRVLILRGTGKHFCGGIDLREAIESFEKASSMFSRVAKILVQLRQIPSVTLASVHGGAFGGGAALIACCDLAVAADDLKLGCPEVLRGFDPVFLFPLFRRKLTDSTLRQLLLTGLPIDAVRTKEIGLVHHVVEKEKTWDFSRDLAEKICQCEPNAVRNAKLLLTAHEYRMYGISLEEELQLSFQSHIESWKTDAAQERVRNFFVNKKV